MRKVYAAEGRRDVQSTAQCLSSWAGGQAAGRCRSPSRSRREQVNFSNGRPSTSSGESNPGFPARAGNSGNGNGNLDDHRLNRAAGRRVVLGEARRWSDLLRTD